MDTVVKSMLEDEDEDKAGLVLFGRDVSKIPCFRESFITGLSTGVGAALVAFLRTSRPMFAQHVGVGMFTTSTLLYWSYCRYQWSRQRFDAQLLQEALKEKILYEGTKVEKEMNKNIVLESV